MEFSAKQIAEYIQGTIVGDENATVHTFAKIEEGIPGALSFLSNPKYTHFIYETQSSIVLVNKDFTPEHEVKATLNVNKDGITFTVNNTSGFQLPSTGGMGIWMFVVGGILVIAFGIFYYRRSKKSA